MCRAACDRSQVIRSNSNPTVARVTWLTRLCQIVLCEDWPGLEIWNSHRPAVWMGGLGPLVTEAIPNMMPGCGDAVDCNGWSVSCQKGLESGQRFFISKSSLNHS